MRIDSKVLSKKIEVVSTHHQSYHYGLTLEIEDYKDKLGIYTGTKDQMSDNEISNLIDTGKIYTFLIDPTVVVENGINLGVRVIKLNGESIYKESQWFNLVFGIFFTLLSATGFFFVNKHRQSKITTNK